MNWTYTPILSKSGYIQFFTIHKFRLYTVILFFLLHVSSTRVLNPLSYHNILPSLHIMLTTTGSILKFVNLTVLFSFKLNLHLLVCMLIPLREYCNLLVGSSTLSATTIIVESSANVAIVKFAKFGISCV